MRRDEQLERELAAEVRRDVFAWFIWPALLALLLLAALWPSSAAAQVAGLCGPGKNCDVRRLRVTDSPLCSRISTQGGAFGSAHSTSNFNLGWYAAGDCSGSQTAQANFNVNGTTFLRASLSAEVGTSTTNRVACSNSGFCFSHQPFGSGSAGTGTAFVSFPACSATYAGQLLYDSTNNVWRQCVSGLGWFALQRVTASATMTFAPATGVTVNAPLGAYTAGNGVFGTEAMHAVNALGTVVTAGSGAGSAVYTLYNESSALSLGVTVTCACNAGAGSTCSVAGTPYIITDDSLAISWRLTTDCATARPAVNLSTHISYQSY